MDSLRSVFDNKKKTRPTFTSSVKKLANKISSTVSPYLPTRMFATSGISVDPNSMSSLASLKKVGKKYTNYNN